MNRIIWNTSVVLSRWRNRLRYALAIPIAYRNWWVVLLVKLGRRVVLELRDGSKYLIRPGTSDLSAVNEAAILNPYLGHPSIVLREDATVVDIGAYIGDFTVQVAQRCRRGRIVAVEPIQEHVDLIATQMVLNGIVNVDTVCAAVGACDGSVAMSVAGMASRISGSDRHNVRLITLSKLIEEYRLDRVDLLKLDCEGAEWDILPAAEEMLAKVDQICMEFHCEHGWTPELLANWLRSRGYAVSHTRGPWNGLLWATRETRRA